MGLLYQRKQSTIATPQTGSFKGAIASDRYDYSVPTPQGGTQEVTQQIPLNAPEPKSLAEETGVLPWQEDQLRKTRGNLTYEQRLDEVRKRNEASAKIQEQEFAKKYPKPQEKKEEQLTQETQTRSGKEVFLADMKRLGDAWGEFSFDMFYGYDPEKKRIMEAKEMRFDKATGKTLYIDDKGEEILIKPWEKMSPFEKASAVGKETMAKGVGAPIQAAVGTDSITAKPIAGFSRSVMGGVSATAQMAQISLNLNPATYIPDLLHKINPDYFKERQENPLLGSITDWANNLERSLKEIYPSESYGEKESLFSDKEGNLTFNPKILRNPEYVSVAIAEQIPNLSFMLATGGWGEGILEGGGEMNNRRAMRLLKGEKVTTVGDALFAGTIGVINGVLGRWGFKGVFEGNTGLQRMVIGKVSNRIVKTIADSGLAIAGEATTEFFQEVIPVLAAKTIYDEGGTWEEAIDEARIAGSSAFTKALVSTAPISITTSASRHIAESKAAQVQAKIESESLEGQQKMYEGVETDAPKGRTLKTGEKAIPVYRVEGGNEQALIHSTTGQPMLGEGHYVFTDSLTAQNFAGKDGTITKEFVVVKPEEVMQVKNQATYEKLVKSAEKAYPDMPLEQSIPEYAKSQGYKVIEGSPQFDNLAGMNAFDKGTVYGTELNPKLVQGRIEDVAQKINNEFGEEAATKFKAEMEGQSHADYAALVAASEKALNKVDLPSYAKHLVPHLVGQIDGESMIAVQRQFREAVEALPEAVMQAVEGAIVKPLTKEDLDSLNDTNKKMVRAALGAAVQLGGEGARVVAQNIEALDTGEVQASQPVSTGTQITPAGEKAPPVQTTLQPGEIKPPVTTKTAVTPTAVTPPAPTRVRVTDATIETHTQTMQALDQRIADSTGSARQQSLLDRANLRDKIVSYLKKNTETHFELLGGKSKSGYALATKQMTGGKFGFGLYLGTQASSTVLPFVGKFSTRSDALRAGIQKVIKLTESGRKAGTLSSAAAISLRNAVQKVNRTLGKQAITKKEVKKVVKEAKKPVVTKTKPKEQTREEARKAFEKAWSKAYGKMPEKARQMSTVQKANFVKHGTLPEGMTKAQMQKVVGRTENMETATPQAKMLAADLAKKSKFSAEKILTKAQEIAGKNVQVGTEHIAKALNELNQIKTKVPSGQMASAGAMVIGNWEQVAAKEGGEPFKLYEKTIGLVRKYAERIGEGHLPRGTQGVFKRMTNNIRIKGLSAIGVAAHEIAHYLDVANTHISDRIINETTRGDKLRKRLTDLYEEFYPGGRRSHKLSTRIVEAFATLLQKYAEMPNTIQAKYPDLVQMVFDKNGKYYNPVFTEIIADLRQISGEYQALSPLDKFGARITKERLETGKRWLTGAEMAREQAVDAIYPMEVADVKTGKQWTKAAAHLWARFYNTSLPTILQHNIMGGKVLGKEVGYQRIINGNIVETLPYNWGTLIKQMTARKIDDDFNYWLVARRVYYEFQEAHELQEAVGSVTKEEMAALKFFDKKGYEETKALKDRLAQLKEIKMNDEFTEIEATEAFHAGDGLFTEETEMFDALNKEDLKFMHDPAVMLINNSSMRKLSSTKGYAGMKRAMFDDIVGDSENQPQAVGVGKNRISTLIRRRGSTRTIISPVATAIWTHGEILRKGAKQIVYNKTAESAHLLPELFDRLELKVIPDPKTGALSFPQESDPNIVMARIGYKRVPFLVDNQIKQVLDEVLTYQDVGTLGRTILLAARTFVKGTTGLFLQFTGINFIVDQLTALANSQYRFIPVYDPIKALYYTLAQSAGETHRFAKEYLLLGGERLTLYGWQNESAQEVTERIANERRGLLKAVDILNKGLDILSFFPRWSEILTRMTEYVKSRQAGESQVVSIERAGRVTAPFHHIGKLGKGSLGQILVKGVPFLNPAMQVLDQSLRQLGDSKKSRQKFLFVAGAITAAQIGSMAFMVGGSSDEQKRKYLQLQPDELGNYFWYPLPNKKDLGKIKIPANLAFLGTFVNMIIANQALNANYSIKDMYAGTTAFIPSQLNPIEDLPRALFGWIPQLLKPAIATVVNLKDYPTLIPLESQSMQRKIPELRYNQNTAKLAKWVGKTFGISPIKFDYLMTGYFGRAWGYFGGKPSAYGIADKFIQQEYFESGRLMQRYYDAKEKNDQEYTSYKKDLTKGQTMVRVNMERTKLAQIQKLLDSFSDLDEEKFPVQAEQQRNQIFNLVRKL